MSIDSNIVDFIFTVFIFDYIKNIKYLLQAANNCIYVLVTITVLKLT